MGYCLTGLLLIELGALTTKEREESGLEHFSDNKMSNVHQVQA